MLRESVRTWAPGWVTAFYLFLWIGLCTQHLLYRWNGLGISVHQLPGRGRNAQLRNMVGWMDYSWYHSRGICWATDTVGAHAAAAIIAPFDASYSAFRRARSACLAAYDAGHWWFTWTVQLYAPAFYRALWTAVNYLVLLLARTWHDPATVPLLAYTLFSTCARYTVPQGLHTSHVHRHPDYLASLPPMDIASISGGTSSRFRRTSSRPFDPFRIQTRYVLHSLRTRLRHRNRHAICR